MGRIPYVTGSSNFTKTARENPRLIDAVFDDAPAAELEYQPGDFQIEESPGDQRYLWLSCPGCKTVSPLAIRPVKDGSDVQSWEMTGTAQAPTLRPSINHNGCWHGWLTNGQFTL